MPHLNLIAADGTRSELEVPDGTTVMQAVTSAGLAGIVGECGGSAMCATCHVYVDDGWRDRLPPMLANEAEMLDCTAAERTEASRLSCQIRMSAALDGLVLRLPERQQ
jgi:2Fe-2S ferredoxin